MEGVGAFLFVLGDNPAVHASGPRRRRISAARSAHLLIDKRIATERFHSLKQNHSVLFADKISNSQPEFVHEFAPGLMRRKRRWVAYLSLGQKRVFHFSAKNLWPTIVRAGPVKIHLAVPIASFEAPELQIEHPLQAQRFDRVLFVIAVIHFAVTLGFTAHLALTIRVCAAHKSILADQSQKATELK